MERLPEQEHKFIIFVGDYTAEHGHGPTWQEIADHLDVGVDVVIRMMEKLRKEGYVE